VESGQRLVRMHVIDHGSGIPPDKHEAIFEKFVRLDRDMHSIVRGSGLGLFITRQLVEAMKGTITVESSGVKGEGSTFSITLPMSQPKGEANPQKVPNRHQPDEMGMDDS
jgi:signal transduction histidine kinase